VPNDDYVVSVGLQWTNRKIGNIVSMYQRPIFKKIPGLGTFCTQASKRRFKKDEIMASCEVFILNLGVTEENESPSSGLLVSWPRYELDMSNVLPLTAA
jgi:hypothetical protein